MQVKIRNRIVDFDINSIDDKWQTQNGTFAFPIVIGNTECFLKKFHQKDKAVDFLKVIKGKEVNYLPAVFDIQNIGGEKLIVFQSFSEGQLFNHLLKDKIFRENIKLDNVFKHLYAALKQVHDLGFWHNDFCSHNILYDVYGNNILLDLDSCIPVSQKVTTDFVINQSLFGIFRNYFLGHHEIDVLEVDRFTGVNYNHLQLASFLTFLQYLILHPEVKYNSKLESDSDLIAEFISKRHKIVQEVFVKGLQNPLTSQDFEELIEYLPFEEDLGGAGTFGGGVNQTQPDLTPKSKTKVPNILEFLVNPVRVQYGGNTIVKWNVENATTVNIEGIGNNLPNHGEREIKNIKKDTVFILKVKNITKQIKAFSNDPVVPQPIVKIFTVNESNNTVFLNKGEKIKVKWDVLNCVKVILDGKEYNPVDSVELVFSKDREVEIIAVNRIGKIENKLKSKTIQLKLKKLQNPAINKFEVNGSTAKTFTFNEGETFDVSWNVSIATKVYLNGAEVKPVGITSRILRNNEVLLLEAINQRDNEIAKVKSSPINLVVRKKASPPPILTPEISKFNILEYDATNVPNKPAPMKNGVYQTNSEGKYAIGFNVSNTEEIFIKIGSDKFYEKFLVDRENWGKDLYIDLSKNKLNKVYEIFIKINYVDTWEKTIEKSIKISHEKIINKPYIYKFNLENTENLANANNAIFVGVAVPSYKTKHNKPIKLSWETVHGDKAILSVDGVSSEEVSKNGTKEIIITNETKKDLTKKIFLTVTNQAGTSTKSLDIIIERKKSSKIIYWIIFILIMLYFLSQLI